MTTDVRPRRSVLYVPGSNARAVDKARSLPVDAVIFDLEDAVAPDAKDAARRAVAEAIGAGGYGTRELVVRVNARDTAWHADDVAAFARSGADAVLLPKVSSSADVEAAAGLLEDAGASPSLAIWIMAETPPGVQAIHGIVASHARLAVVVMGNEDLAAALRVDGDEQRTGLIHAMSRCVLAARSGGLDILDGVYTNLANTDGLAAVCRQGRALGFDGKTLIHPGQIAVANEVFGVPDAAVSTARDIVAAWDRESGDSAGVIVAGGRMIERLHVDAARRVLALHAAITDRQTEI